MAASLRFLVGDTTILQQCRLLRPRRPTVRLSVAQNATARGAAKSRLEESIEPRGTGLGVPRLRGPLAAPRRNRVNVELQTGVINQALSHGVDETSPLRTAGLHGGGRNPQLSGPTLGTPRRPNSCGFSAPPAGAAAAGRPPRRDATVPAGAPLRPPILWSRCRLRTSDRHS